MTVDIVIGRKLFKLAGSPPLHLGLRVISAENHDIGLL